ncbi:protein kinase D4 isoform X2 [Denticeps clupeoides]|uniref:protein kinase D4 isoform X2 n=1 Tax=Denticeps clupeoides TaxID=299321 RepID=UPI0010A48DEF|nr:serine/threonine-protein kinase D3-like isoform X2 [Denticeps clupeoides]
MAADEEARPRKAFSGTFDLDICSSLTLMSLEHNTGPKKPIVVQFQIGLFKEVVQAPEVSVIGVGEKLLLFKHEPDCDNLLKRLTERDTVQDGDSVEVVLSASASVAEVKIRPHSLMVQSYRTPTFCHRCGQMLWGLVRQGLKCEGCGLDVHKHCALHLANDCSRVLRRCGPSVSLFPPGRPRAPSLSTPAGGSLEEISMSKPRSRPAFWAEQPVWLGVGQGREGPPRLPHTFHVHSYAKTTACHHCRHLLKGLFRQGLQCSDCKLNCHRRCQSLIPNDCLGDRKATNGDGARSSDYEPLLADDGVDLGVPVQSVNDLYEELCPKRGLPESDELQQPAAISPCFSSNIPLQRVVQSVRHTKRHGGGGGVLKEGWLLHHTDTDSLRKRHYWILDGRSITLYQDESSNKYFKELALSEVLQVRGRGQLTEPGGPHSFELATAALVYCVGAADEGREWESAIRSALMPVQGGGNGPQDEEAQVRPGEIKHVDTSNRSKAYRNVCFQDIGAVYQIFSEEVLGSGQFGIVYGGAHRQSGRQVAVKVVDKSRFPTKLERQTRNEVAILQTLSHLGVIFLEAMFETAELVFVVMEKLHGDMLEMILSNENGRLPERNTRFLVTQILEALRYLHLKHIAHCDLKPENVLLASPEPFPQVKLCDFGFARIIGEKSFRRSLVGTPAYLAPEVVRDHGYNRSLDMWAVGVILYVSLSGTFPFNEDEDVAQQITNAAFMYPRQLWSLVSLEAVNLINNLLQVVVRRRFSVGKAMGHAWLQNYQLWCDLREFEQRMGRRYLTHEEEDEHWRRHAEQKGLAFPSHLAEPP